MTTGAAGTDDSDRVVALIAPHYHEDANIARTDGDEAIFLGGMLGFEQL